MRCVPRAPPAHDQSLGRFDSPYGSRRRALSPSTAAHISHTAVRLLSAWLPMLTPAMHQLHAVAQVKSHELAARMPVSGCQLELDVRMPVSAHHITHSPPCRGLSESDLPHAQKSKLHVDARR